MRDLPRHLSVEELAELFEGRTAFVERLAEVEHPLENARAVAATLTDEQRKEVLDAHPAIGERKKLSKHSAAEQGADHDPAVIAELLELNRRYEERFGFRCIVFVNRRPKSELVPVMRERLERTREQELDAGLDELISIAIDRWQRS